MQPSSVIVRIGLFGQQCQDVCARSGDHVGGDQLAERTDFCLSGFDGCIDGRDVTFDDDGDVAAAELFFRQHFDVGGFAGGIDRFENGGEPLSFDKAQCEVWRFCHGGISCFGCGGFGRFGLAEHHVLIEQGTAFLATEDADFHCRWLGIGDHGYNGRDAEPSRRQFTGIESGGNRIDRSADFNHGAEEIVQFGLDHVDISRLFHGVQGNHGRSKSGHFEDADAGIHKTGPLPKNHGC